MQAEHKAQDKTSAITGCRRLCTLALVLASVACNRFGHYTLVSQEYGFSVTFPERPEAQSDKNYQGRPKHLWTLYRNNYQEFYSAQATSYKDALPTEGWLPGKEVGEVAGIELMGGRRFKLCSAATGREAVAIATTSLAPSGGIISSVYIIDGTKLISITARTRNQDDKAAFLGSLTLLR